MTYAQRFAALASILLLPSCTMAGPVGISASNFGEAASRDIAAQTVNPNAPADSAPIDFEGQRAEAAQRRYVTGAVIAPGNISAGSTASDSNSGGAGPGAATGSGGTGSGGAGGR